MSSATPNMTTARIAFRAWSGFALKFSLTASIPFTRAAVGRASSRVRPFLARNSRARPFLARTSRALGFLVHRLEVHEARRPHVHGGIHVHVNEGGTVAGERALDGAAQCRGVVHALAVSAHRLRDLREVDVAEVGPHVLVRVEALPDEH